MDTKEKNREAARQHRAQQPTGQDTGNRSSGTAPRRQETQKRTKGSADPARQDRRRNTRQKAEQTRTQRRSAGAAQRQAPQGTGPRKSAPRRTSQEEAAARQKKPAAQPEKQSDNREKGILGVFSGNRRKPRRELTPEEKAEQRRRKQEAAAERKRKRESELPAVVYTQPAPFNRDRLLLQLLTVVAIVVAVILGMSVFFKVKTITVAGAETYSAWAIREASGIREGDNLLTFSKARAGAQIRAELSYVDNVRIGIKLPDTVIIYIEELDVAYSVKSDDGDWWLITSDGRVVEQITEKTSENYTQVLGVALEEPQVGLQGVAAELVPTETLENGDPVPVTVTGAQRLSSALQILKALEANDIVGEAASVNVSSLEEVTLWYGSRYEVLLGDISRMDYKIACMNDAILQMSDYQSGILDVSFTTRVNQVVYTPFG